MRPDFEEKYYENEQKNWWFMARRYTILQLLKDVDKNSKILDVGCGGGALLNNLKQNKFSDTYGIDTSLVAIQKCQNIGLTNISVMDGQHPSFPDNTFDIIVLSDVLEHFESDESALEKFYKIIKPNGKIIIFVPAFSFLWSYFDEINRHYRRYNKSSLALKLNKVNFNIEKKSYWNFSLFFPAFLISVVEKCFVSVRILNKGEILLKYPGGVVNTLLIGLLKLENIFFRIFGLPVGMSVFAMVSKRV